MFKLILEAYGIPPDVVSAIRVMTENTSAVVITPEGETEQFAIDTGVLQGDPLALFLFIICLDCALRSAITDSDGHTLKRRRSSRHPAVVLPDLDYADDIALLENTIKSAQDLLNRVEKACQDVGLFLNAPKTKYMHLNPSTNTTLVSSDGSPIELVQDFKYLGGYTDSGYDMNTRIGQAWSALNSLDKSGKPQSRTRQNSKFSRLQSKPSYSTVQTLGNLMLHDQRNLMVPTPKCYARFTTFHGETMSQTNRCMVTFHAYLQL